MGKKRRKLDNYRKLYLDNNFKEWWEAFPRKIAKATAYETWKAAIEAICDVKECSRKKAVSFLLSRTLLFKESAAGKSKEFCPYPSSWLNAARWDDDIEEWNKQKTSGIELDPEKAQQWTP